MRSGNSYFVNSPMLAAASQVGPQRMKYLLVTGGVCSSLGKGVTTSSIGALLRQSGFHVSAIKIDPYINVDAGLMSPFEHGEVYVLADGGEVDLDLGNYERWLRVRLSRGHNITTGKVYETLIQKERQGGFLGKTVQVIPHVTDEVVRRVVETAEIAVDGSGMKPQICLIELGGTIGDIESAPFVEALRQLRFSIPPEDFCLAHVTYLPTMGESQKTKPTQHSCRTLLSLGMSPDFLVCRSEGPLTGDARRKISSLVGLQEKYIFDAHNCGSLYEVPILFHSQDLVAKIVHKMKLDVTKPSAPAIGIPTIDELRSFAQMCTSKTSRTIDIAFVGKYCDGGTDAYFSVMQAFEHASLAAQVRINFLWIESESLEGESSAADELRQQLTSMNGIFVAGGFGNRGIEGKVIAARIARERKIPYLGVCLGMQIALIEMGRHLLGLPDATSEEFDSEKGAPAKSQHHVIIYMPEIDRNMMGANMRLGAREAHITAPGSIMQTIYCNAQKVTERHRHRYEFNMAYLEQFRKAGVIFSAADDPAFGKDTRVEAIELSTAVHPYFLGIQYHPEFMTWVTDPSPPYAAFVAAAAGVPNTLQKEGNTRRTA